MMDEINILAEIMVLMFQKHPEWRQYMLYNARYDTIEVFDNLLTYTLLEVDITHINLILTIGRKITRIELANPKCFDNLITKIEDHLIGEFELNG